MRVKKLSLAVSLVCAIALVPHTVVQAAPVPPEYDGESVNLVVDVSGSMWGTPLAQAQDALRTSVDQASADVAIGLRSYAGACGNGGQQLVRVGLDNRADLLQAVDSLSAGGGTPTPDALRAAVGDLPDNGDRTIVLISDGQSSCGPACPVAEELLLSEEVGFTAFTVGFNAPDAAAADLTCVAEVTGGSYVQATDTQGLIDAISGAIGREPPIVLVHGIDWQGQSGVDCDETWGDLRGYLEQNGFSDRDIVTIAYYDGDTNCDADINTSWKPGLENSYFDGVGAHGSDNGHTAEAAIEHLGYHLAWWIYGNYSSRGVPVDIVAHSMGGLITRFAVGKVDNGHEAFPPLLLVQDAVTLGTPHGGARYKVLNTICGQRQCSQMRPGDGFLTSLEAEAWNPQGTGGTDWTAIGSDDDNSVAADRAVGSSRNRKKDAYFGACHKVWYPNLEHGEYMSAGADGPLRRGNGGLFIVYTSGDTCGAPLERVRVQLLSPVGQIAAAIGSSDF